MSCNEALRVQEYFDGELDAGAAADVERHLETCAECAALLKDLNKATMVGEDAEFSARMAAYEPSAGEEDQWKALFKQTRDRLRGSTFDPKVFDETCKLSGKCG